MKKRTIIIAAAVLIITVFAALNFTKKPQPKYTTADVAVGDVLQTVSATGTVEAAKKLDLRFVNSGKINQINVKVGDYVESGTVLAKLDTAQLESQLLKAKASLSAANANLSKLLEGATAEDIKVYETAVENAQISLDNAQKNLADAQKNADKEIAQSQASTDSAQVTFGNALQSLENTKISNENNLNKVYDNAWNTINSSLLTIFDSLDKNQTALDYEDAQDTLSFLNTQYLSESTASKAVAGSSYSSTKNYIDSIKSNPTHQGIDQSVVYIKSTLEKTKTTLYDTGNVLQATITSSKLSQTELDTLKSDISAARTNINTAISNVIVAEQNIQTQKITNQTNLDNAQATVNSAQSSLNLANESLAATRSSSNVKINTAQNSVKSAEGALKQAEDQLAFKKAGPRTADVSLYRAQYQEAQANADLIQNQINDSVLVAPQNGVITEINKEVGETVNSAEKFVSIITAENFEINANVSEVDIAKIKIDDKVEITFDALGPDKKFFGKISKIDPAETEISGVIYYKTTTMFSGDSQTIKPGMTANLDVMTAKKENAVVIPFQALKEKNGQKYVQVFENGKTKDVPIEVGLRGDINLEVISGLVAGQKVVTFMEE